MSRRVRLEGISLAGKNKVRENGELWDVVEIRNNVSCLGGGTGYLLKSIVKPNYVRWVKTTGDEDFRVFNEKSGEIK